jgi:hypothetical protein
MDPTTVNSKSDDELYETLILRLTNAEYVVSPLNSTFFKSLSDFILLVAPHLATSKLERLGQNGDGGYVIAAESSDAGKRAVSLGVGYEVSADLDLLKAGYDLVAVDGSVENPLPDESRYHFLDAFIGYSQEKENDLRYSDVLKRMNWAPAVDLVLVDIEGHEWALISKEWKTISQARQVVIEFHGLELLGDPKYSSFFIDVLRNINRTHQSIHVHANNAGHTMNVHGAGWPTILEVTFLRLEECHEERNFGPFPGELDFPNLAGKTDIDLSPFFGENPLFAILTRNVISSLGL